MLLSASKFCLSERNVKTTYPIFLTNSYIYSYLPVELKIGIITVVVCFLEVKSSNSSSLNQKPVKIDLPIYVGTHMTTKLTYLLNLNVFNLILSSKAKNRVEWWKRA